MAPEQALGRNDLIGPATDIYAVGVILYMMLSATPPFSANDPISLLDKVKYDLPAPVTSFRSDVSPVLAAILQRCLAKAPEDRFRTAEELVAALDRFLQGDQTSNSGVTATGLIRRAWDGIGRFALRLITFLPRSRKP
jgi:serine/threonine protein kinase